MTYYTALALKRLDRIAEATELLCSLLNYAEGLARDGTQRTHLLDQLAVERGRAHHVARRGRLRNIVGGTCRERLQGDVGILQRQRRRHHDL